MTNPCTPPPGTPEGYHYLAKGTSSKRYGRWWTGAVWKYLQNCPQFTTPQRMASCGWSYIGPVEPAETLQSITAYQHPLGSAFEQVWHVNVAKLYEMEPTPPDAKDALLLEAAEVMERMLTETEGYQHVSVDSKVFYAMEETLARIRANLKGE